MAMIVIAGFALWAVLRFLGVADAGRLELGTNRRVLASDVIAELILARGNLPFCQQIGR